MVVGDFNATLDHGPVRDLLGLGLRDAARESNAGWQPTWPAWLPLIAVDHVLVSRDLGVISTKSAVVEGTDHRALVAEVRW
jgi:endonuclease/exonuclease/phosphatase family metal-dependent hydrolase